MENRRKQTKKLTREAERQPADQRGHERDAAVDDSVRFVRDCGRLKCNRRRWRFKKKKTSISTASSKRRVRIINTTGAATVLAAAAVALKR